MALWYVEKCQKDTCECKNNKCKKLATLLRAHGGTHDNSQAPDKEDSKDGSFDEVLEVDN